MKKFLLVGVAFATLSISALAEEAETSYKTAGIMCTEMDALPKIQSLFNKYGDPGATMIAAAEHNLPCLVGTMITKEEQGKYVMSFPGTNNTNFDIFAWQWGEATVFSMMPAKEKPKESSY